MTNWYDLVSKDISKIPDAVEYFNTELIAAKAEIKISGRIEKASAHLPASVETRFSQLQEIEAILNILTLNSEDYVLRILEDMLKTIKDN